MDMLRLVFLSRKELFSNYISENEMYIKNKLDNIMKEIYDFLIEGRDSKALEFIERNNSELDTQNWINIEKHFPKF
jgi:hypothetical protein